MNIRQIIPIFILMFSIESPVALAISENIKGEIKPIRQPRDATLPRMAVSENLKGVITRPPRDATVPPPRDMARLEKLRQTLVSEFYESKTTDVRKSEIRSALREINTLLGAGKVQHAELESGRASEAVN